MALARAGPWCGGELALALSCGHFCVSPSGASWRKPPQRALEAVKEAVAHRTGRQYSPQGRGF